MRAGGLQYRVKNGACAALAACAAALLAGCAASTTYAGIPLTAGAADPEIQSLARRARAGDKHAQLDLGIRYEEGLGIGRDVRRALRLYRAAARTTGGRSVLHIPPAGGKGGVATIPVSTGRRVEGLTEARYRLLLLNHRLRGTRKGE